MLLKFLRKRKNMKRIMWALAILIIPAFVIWGTGSATKNKTGRPEYAGKLYNKKISYEEYYDMFNVVRDYVLKNVGGNIPEEFIGQMAWMRIILLEEAKRQKIKVKDSEVIEKIMGFLVFQRNGLFDKKLYASMLGDNARGFEERLRDDIAISNLKDKITAALSISDEETGEDYKKRFEKIKSSYILLPFNKYEKDVQYQESDLLTFYNTHKESFRKPAEVNVKYLEVPLASEETAYKALDGAVNKKNLEGPAKEFSLEVKETGFFSQFQEIPAIGQSYDFIKAIFALKPKEIHKILIKTEKSLYIIQLKEKKESCIPDFREVKNAVKEAFVKGRVIQLAEKESQKLLLSITRDIKNGKTFEDAVKQYNLEIKTMDFISRDGYIPDVGPAQEFAEKAFSLKIGELGGPVKMLQSWVILRPDAFQGIDEKKFEEEKIKFKEGLLANKKEEIFNKWFETLQKKAQFISYTNIK